MLGLKLSPFIKVGFLENMAIWIKCLTPEDLLLTKIQQGTEQLNWDILISASMPYFSERFHHSFSPLILSSSSLLLVTAPSNSKTFPPSYYALPFNLLLFPFYCWKQVYKECFSSSKDLPTMGSSSFVGLWPNCYHSGCSSRFLPNATAVLHNVAPGHKPLLPVQTTFSQDK